MRARYLTSFDLQTFIQAAREVPYQQIHSDLFPGIEVWIRRDDLLDPIISGNKAYKLLFNLLEAKEQGAHTLITCGGAWSNHIHATAAAGLRFGFRTIGIIRGHRPPQPSAALQDAERFGMQLHFVSREAYRRRQDPDFPQSLGLDCTRALYIPEGGANLAGARGAQLLGQVIAQTAPQAFSQIWLACGTGVTLSGVQLGVGPIPVVGVPVLKAASSIRTSAHSFRRSLLVAAMDGGNADFAGPKAPRMRGAAGRKNLPGDSHRWPDPKLLEGYHCGGYAKYPRYLAELQHQFEREAGIPLDPVYTAKLVYALHRETREGKVGPGTRILLLHSSGLQGRRGY